MYQPWIKFARIHKLNKNEDFVVKLTAESLFFNIDIKKIKNKKINLIPPILDFRREFLVKNIVDITDDKYILQLDTSEDDFKYLDKFDILHHYFIIKKIDLKSSYNINSCSNLENYEFLNLCNKSVVDNKYGYLGKVTDIRGTKNQKYMIVSTDNASRLINDFKISSNEILIPVVQEYIKSIDSEIIVDIPHDLIELN